MRAREDRGWVWKSPPSDAGDAGDVERELALRMRIEALRRDAVRAVGRAMAAVRAGRP